MGLKLLTLKLQLIFLYCIKTTMVQDITPSVDIKILSELPLENLIRVRNSLEEVPDGIDLTSREYAGSGPQALALKSRAKQSKNRGGTWEGEHHYYQPSGKGSHSKVQTIFQSSVTALAFLAFGGYLLCLLIQALKSKQNTTGTTAAALVSILRKKSVMKRHPQKYQATRPNHRIRRDVWPEVDEDRLYSALVMVSEAYTQYHTINYRDFNSTLSRFRV